MLHWGKKYQTVHNQLHLQIMRKKKPLGKKLSSNSKFHALKTYLLRAEWIIWMFLLIFWLRQSSGGCRMIQSITPSVYIQHSLCFSLPRQRLCLVIKRCGVNVTPLLCGCRSSDWHRNSPAVHEDSKNLQSLPEITQREKEKRNEKTVEKGGKETIREWKKKGDRRGDGGMLFSHCPHSLHPPPLCHRCNLIFKKHLDTTCPQTELKA